MITKLERERIRNLAKQVAETAEMPIQAERRERWKRHNALQAERPMILIFPEGSWRELSKTFEHECESDEARAIEGQLLTSLYYRDHLNDDNPIEREWVVNKKINSTGWGLERNTIASSEATGAWHFDPVIFEPKDLSMIKTPEISYDEKETMARFDMFQGLLGDILDVKLKGVTHISYHLMNQYTGWRGLEEVMLDMYTEPQMLHDAMAILEAGHKHVLQQYIDQSLLSLNNDKTYHNSGGNGYNDTELPVDGFDPDRVRPCDMWASAEAQEMAQVGPEQHAEFILEYEKRLLEPFALTGYGCCEDLTRKLDDVFTIPQIRRISISPWADVEKCAEKLQRNYIFSWKPHPAHLVGDFDQGMIRGYLRHALEHAKRHNCAMEMILKDTHTCEDHPERFDIWSNIAREEIDSVYG